MKRIFIIVIFLLSGTAYGQAFQRGTRVFNAGIRIQNSLVPVFANAEFSVADRVGVGGQLWYARKYDVSVLAPGIFANYHFPVAIEQIDPYVGAGLNLWRFSESGYSESLVTFNLQAGLRYYFNERIGAMGQLNLDITEGGSPASLNIGISYKF